jgi:protein TonB
MAAAVFRDDPWRRVPWLLPAATALTLLSVMGFLKLLAGPPFVTLPAPAVEVEVIELAPSASALRAPPAPPPPPAAEPPPVALETPPPPPLLHPTLPPLPTLEPDPTPAPAVKPAPPPPPPQPRPPRSQRTAPSTAPPVAAAPAAPTPAPAPPVASTPPNGGNMGARALYQPLPEIPEELRRRALDLVAVARFRVAANGSAEVELIQPTPDAALNRALLDTLKKWRFFPAMEGGKPQASTLEIRIPISVR